MIHDSVLFKSTTETDVMLLVVVCRIRSCGAKPFLLTNSDYYYTHVSFIASFVTVTAAAAKCIHNLLVSFGFL